jgi:hypothetical protein
MLQPEDLSHGELADLVRSIRNVLYLDVDSAGGEILNPEKEWDADTLTCVAEKIAMYDLIPPRADVGNSNGQAPL